MRLAFLSLVPVLLLGACATDGRTAATATPDDAVGHSAYGMFLAGEAAMNDGQSQEAGQFFSRVQANGADEGLLSERAFTAALLAGDVDRAAAIAPDGDEVSDGA